MANNEHERPDPEDMFNDTRMSFGDHIEELRTHLLRAIKCLAIGMVISLYPLGSYVFQIIVDPVEQQLKQFEVRAQNKQIDDYKAKLVGNPGQMLPPARFKIGFDRQQLRDAVLKDVPAKQPAVLDMTIGVIEGVARDLEGLHAVKEQVPLGPVVLLDMELPLTPDLARAIVPLFNQINPKRVTTMSITEAFIVYLKISLLTGLVLSSPWVFYHIWSFIAAGLYPQEKKLVNVYLPFSVFLFLAGVLLCQFVVMPKAIAVMLSFNEWLGLSADLRLEEWLSFALLMPLVFGLSFQTPLIMLFLNTVNIVSIEAFRKARRISWFAMATFAAIILPTLDPYSMLLMWVPMCALYELGILLCVWRGDTDSAPEEDEERKDELVEV
jgi:sec-independent protein translocase protein TatC